MSVAERLVCLVSIPLFVLSGSVSAAQRAGHSASPPPLVLDDLPPAVRASLQRAADDARTRPDDAAAVGRLSMMLHAFEQHRLAAAYYETAAKLAPDDFAWTYLLGVVRAELGEHEPAATLFRRSLQLDPTYVAAHLRLAEALLASGDLDGSESEYQALVNGFPELALGHYGLGRVRSARGEPQRALEHYRRAADLTPRFGRAHYALALAYRDAGFAQRAEEHLDLYRQHGARSPAVPDPVLDNVRSLVQTARELIAQAARLGADGRLEESIALHVKALEADPAAAQAHVNLIALYGRTRQVSLASQHYRAALKLGANLGEAHYNYGVLQASLGRQPDAAAAFQRALDVDPFHAQAHNNLAALLAQRGQYAQAVVHYQQALASDPHHRAARFGLGGALLAADRPREAIAQFETLVGHDGPEVPRYKQALAAAWLRSGDPLKARQYATDALEHAMRLRQTELAARIQADLEKMNKVRR